MQCFSFDFHSFLINFFQLNHLKKLKSIHKLVLIKTPNPKRATPLMGSRHWASEEAVGSCCFFPPKMNHTMYKIQENTHFCPSICREDPVLTCVYFNFSHFQTCRCTKPDNNPKHNHYQCITRPNPTPNPIHTLA